MELVAKINNDDKINLQFVKEDRDYFYNRLYQEFSGKVLERIEYEVKLAVGREIGILLESVVKSAMDKMTSNIYEVVQKSLCNKIDAVIEQEKIRLKHVPFTIEYKYITNNNKPTEAEAERYLKDMYEKAGYHCSRSKDNGFFHWVDEKRVSIIPFPGYAEALEDKFGIPDLVVWNDKEAFFVEVKLITGSVQGNQLVWYAKHPSVNSIICFVGIDKDMR